MFNFGQHLPVSRQRVTGLVALVVSVALTSLSLVPAHAVAVPTPGTPPTSLHAPIDLALGEPYTVGAQWPDPLFSELEASRPTTAGQLTSGNVAPLRYSSPRWVGFLQQYGRSITINLGRVDNVDAVSLQCLQDIPAGIAFPDTVRYYGSVDDLRWYPLGLSLDQPQWYNNTVQKQNFLIHTDVNAQYVRAQFTDKVWTLADQFIINGFPHPSATALPWHGPGLTQLMGTDYLVDPNAPAIATPTSVPHPGYLSADAVTGNRIADLELLQTGQPGAPGAWDEKDFLPMVGQMNAERQPVGWLFDGILFDPDATTATSASSWSGWSSALFERSLNASALNQTVARLSQALHDPHYREQVILAIPGTSADPADFGSIGPGEPTVDMDPAKVGFQTADQNKERAIRWFVNRILAKWREADYTHLQLVGFYWQPETVSLSDPDDPGLIEATAALVHRHHLLFYWIPYDGAYGIPDAEKLGFNAVVIQPGVSFDWGIHPEARLQSVAAMARYYGDGIEIELNWNIMSWNPALFHTALAKYTDYFTAGYLFGYEGDTLKAYYLNTNSLLDSYMSPFVPIHSAYTDTEQFVDGQWTERTFL
ncbi:MAG: DUF4855 domain-containing protein [Firmicutes bacterium]|nr:DUF4855 domain-containing protein [Bacillota bacterium]